MAIRILAADPVDAAAVAKLRADGYEVVEKHYELDELGTALKDFDAVIIRAASKVKKQQLDDEAGGKLKLIIRAGVGMDNIDIPYAESMGITCRNTPNSSSNAVAELAIALLFSCSRSISIAGHTMREHRWEKKSYEGGFELPGKTMGIIGYGRIGRLVGAKAQALGMNVLSVVHRNKPEGVECDTMHFVTMDELLAKSDVITLCAPSGNKPLVDAEAIAKMKDGVVLINVSRGSNIVEQDVLDGLNSGKIRAAGIDVWMDEKNPNWELASHPKVSPTPHIGGSTKEGAKKIGDEIVGIVKEFFE
jgi:D-3-phosphoglycerate dehydrogenase